MNDFEKGQKAERERVQALMSMKQRPGYGAAALQETLDDCIVQGKTIEEASEAIVNELTKNSTIAEMENPPDIDTGGTDTATGEGSRRAAAKEPVAEV